MEPSKPTPIALFSEMMKNAPHNVVNVASVRQLSPFRYPGGKTWLVPRIRQWLLQKAVRPAELIEPFAGGGIISLTVAAEQLADHVTMIELDPDIAAVWQTIFNGDAEGLVSKIVDFELTLENAQHCLATTPESPCEQAFQTIIKNRTYHGGILAPGSTFLKFGENGKGITSRWYPQTLARRIRYLVTLRPRITFIQGDGLEHLERTCERADVAYFIDPPYTAPGKGAGRRLYRYSAIDHERLFEVCRQAAGDFIMTYDDSEVVKAMAVSRELVIEKVLMKNTHHTELYELLIKPNGVC